MIILGCEQRSEEWIQARLGIPTSSEFARIVTPTGKPSDQSEAYMFRLLGEWLTGESEDAYRNKWMERGTELEPEAKAYYEFVTDLTVQTVGFVYKDERKLVGCSPDGLLDDRGLEIKAPSAGVHLRYLLRNDIPTTYIPQVQGSLWVTGKETWEWFSYHPRLPSVLITVRRDERYIRALDSAMNAFIDEMLSRREELIKRGVTSTLQTACAG